jgi:hypothetical protein
MPPHMSLKRAHPLGEQSLTLPQCRLSEIAQRRAASAAALGCLGVQTRQQLVGKRDHHLGHTPSIPGNTDAPGVPTLAISRSRRRVVFPDAALVSYGTDPNHAYIRRSAAAIALACIGLRAPPEQPLTIAPRAMTSEQLAAILAHTNHEIAGFLLTTHLTGLADSLIELIGGDQITDDAILGCG